MKSVVRTMVYTAVALAPLVAGAQGGGARRGQGRGVPPDQRIDRQLGRVVQQQLNLSDAQAAKMQETNRKFLDRRQTMNEEERQARNTIREVLCTNDSTRSADVSRALDQVLDVQKRRVQLLEEEQRELSMFLTPFQRARFLGMSERIMDAGGRGGRGGRMGPPPNGGPGGPPNGPPNGPPPGAAQGGPNGPPDMCGPPPDQMQRRGGRGRGQ